MFNNLGYLAKYLALLTITIITQFLPTVDSHYHYRLKSSKFLQCTICAKCTYRASLTQVPLGQGHRYPSSLIGRSEIKLESKYITARNDRGIFIPLFPS